MTEEYTIRSDLTVSGDDIVINRGAITVFPGAGYMVMSVTSEGKRIILPLRIDLALLVSERLSDTASDLARDIVDGFYRDMDRMGGNGFGIDGESDGPDRSVDKEDGDRGCP